jgi:peptidoglycan LD-endopeptidase CwlK
MDSVNQEKISKLHPKLRGEVSAIIEEINQKVLTGNSKVRITQGLRTFEEQDALYTQGRNGDKRKKVTNAKGGQSIHNYGLAVDFCLIVDGKDVSWDVKKDFDSDKQSDWMEVVTVFKKYGWSWGGDWRTFKDMPHFEKSFGYTWKELLSKKISNLIDSERYVLID